MLIHGNAFIVLVKIKLMDYNYRNIIISGPPGPGKTSLTNKLADETGFKIYYIGGLFRKKHAELIQRGETNLSFEDWWVQLPDLEQIEINNKIKTLAEIGGIIGDTRYAKLCENTNSLHVFLYAPLEIRVQRALEDKKYLGKTQEEIKKILLKREKDELEVGIKLFSIDYRNQNDYHLALNTGKLTVIEEIKAIMSLMKK